MGFTNAGSGSKRDLMVWRLAVLVFGLVAMVTSEANSERSKQSGRALTPSEIEEFVKRNNDKFIKFPVDDFEVAMRSVEKGMRERRILEREQQKGKRYAECTRLQCTQTTIGGKPYTQCQRVSTSC